MTWPAIVAVAISSMFIAIKNSNRDANPTLPPAPPSAASAPVEPTDAAPETPADSPTGTTPAPPATTATTVFTKTEEVVHLCEPSVCRIFSRHPIASGSGTGFVVGPNLICTNDHVMGIADDSDLEVEFPSRGKVSYKGISLAYTIRGVDLVILNVPGLTSDYTPLSLDPIADLHKGEKLVFIGNPQGLEMVVTEGAYGSVQNMEGVSWLQLSGTVNPGNSGGPALTMRGRVAGIITLKHGNAEGIGFAIPADTLQKALTDIRTFTPDRLKANVVGFKARQAASKLLISGSICLQLIGKTLAALQEAKTTGGKLEDILNARVPSAERNKIMTVSQVLNDEVGTAIKSLERDGFDGTSADLLKRLNRHAGAIRSQTTAMRGDLTTLATQATDLLDKFKTLETEAESQLDIEKEDLVRVANNLFR